MKTYTGKLTKLPPNDIFVFGSNTQGRHGKGAALDAIKYFRAIYGQPEGLQGQSYAIITKDLTKYKHPSISTLSIISQIHNLYKYAINNPNNKFYIAYKIGNNLNGYTSKEMADIFSDIEIPNNIVFDEEFSKLLTIK